MINVINLSDYRELLVFMKQAHDSSDDYKFPVTANETLSEKSAIFMQLLLIPTNSDETIYLFIF